MRNELTAKKKLIIFALVAFVMLIWAAIEFRKPPIQQPHEPTVVDNVHPKNPVNDMYTRSVEMGTKLNADDLIYNVTDWYFADEASGHKADDGNCYLFVKASVKNENTIAKIFNDYIYSIYYNEQYQYLDSYTMSDEYIKRHDNIIPLETIEGLFAFEVPAEVQEAKSLVFTVSKNVYDDPYRWNIILK